MKTKEYATGIDTVGEKALWQSVIMQAAIDVTSSPATMKDRMERAKSIAWFSLYNEDFLLVCSFAGMNPYNVLRGVKKAMQHRKKIHKKRRTKQLMVKKTTIHNDNTCQHNKTIFKNA